MEVKIFDSFFESLKNISKHNTWWYKTWDLFYRDIPRFISNIWIYRRGLWNNYKWDHHGSLLLFEIGLTELATYIDVKGHEVDESRNKKIKVIRRVVELISNYNRDSYIEQAESELGKMIYRKWEFESIPNQPNLSRVVDNYTEEEKIHNNKIFNRSYEIEKSEWDELFYLLKGQDYSKFDSNMDWSEQFDGSGLKGWWD
jgi:hypothetical protein